MAHIRRSGKPHPLRTIAQLALAASALTFSRPVLAYQDVGGGWRVISTGDDDGSGLLTLYHDSGAALYSKFISASNDLDKPYEIFAKVLRQGCSDPTAIQKKSAYSGNGYYSESGGSRRCSLSIRRTQGGVMATAIMGLPSNMVLATTTENFETALINAASGSSQRSSASVNSASATYDSNAVANGPLGPDMLAGKTVPRPLGIASTLSSRTVGFPPMRTNEQIRWYLFPGGVAHSCDNVDPRSLTMTLEALDAQRGCEGARWRKVGNRVEIQEDDGDEWEDTGTSDAQNMRKGMKLDAHYTTQGGYSTMNTAVLTGGGVWFTSDGRFRAESSFGFGGNYGAVSASGGNSREGLSGTYELDGYILKVTNGSQTTYRYVYFAPREGKPYGYIQFEGKLYWDE